MVGNGDVEEAKRFLFIDCGMYELTVPPTTHTYRQKARTPKLSIRSGLMKHNPKTLVIVVVDVAKPTTPTYQQNKRDASAAGGAAAR